MDGRMLESGKLEANFVRIANGLYLVKTWVANTNKITKVIVK